PLFVARCDVGPRLSYRVAAQPGGAQGEQSPFGIAPTLRPQAPCGAFECDLGPEDPLAVVRVLGVQLQLDVDVPATDTGNLIAFVLAAWFEGAIEAEAAAGVAESSHGVAHVAAPQQGGVA